MIDIKKYSLGELEVIYDNMDEETQKWMLDKMHMWFGWKNPNDDSTHYSHH